MPTEIKILAVRTLPTLDPSRAGQIDTIVVYRATNNPLDTDSVVLKGKQQPTEAEVIAAIQASRKARAAHEGKTLQV
jgi:hypothetical protein